MDTIFRTTLEENPEPNTPIHVFTRQLFSFSQRLIHAQVAEMISSGQTVGEFTPLQESTRKARSTRKSGEEIPDMFVGQSYSLVQKSANGSYFFTSPLHRYVDDAHFDSQLSKLKIQPTLSTPMDDVPLLSSSAYSLRRMNPSSKPLPLKVKIMPVEFPDYGLYSTFAPLVDTSKASLSRSESVFTKLRGRQVFVDPLPPPPTFKDGKIPIYNGSTPSNYPQLIVPMTKNELQSLLPSTELKRESIDSLSTSDLNAVDLLHQLEGSFEDLQDSPELLLLLKRNFILLKRLHEFQLERYQVGNHKVCPSELQVASALQRNLLKLAAQHPPHEWIHQEHIRKAMESVKLTEKAFSGSLPPNTPFVFGCNTMGNGVIPTGAGTRLLSIQ